MRVSKLILTKGIDITSASEQVVADIAPFVSCFEEDQIIIVPDRYSLITEKLVFDKLALDSTLNIKVMGINRFASLILQKQNAMPKSMSNNSALIALGKAVYEEKDNFKFFPKSNIDVSFLQQIKNTIAQLKTSEVTPEKLEKLADDKIHDIYLIYKNYEEKQKTGVDLADFLDVFIQNIEKADFENTRIYFAFFDSMTSQGLNIVNLLLKKTKSVEFALASPQPQQKNKFIYDTALENNLKNLAREANIEIEEKNVTSSNFVSNFISNNIYLSNPQNINLKNFASFWECSTADAQFEAVAREIKSHVVLGGRYSDCVVGVSALDENYCAIKRIFEDYEIPCFFDVDLALAQTKPIEFLNLVFEFVEEKDMSILYDIISNIYSNLDGCERGKICEFLDKYKLVDQDLDLHKLENEDDEKTYEKIKNILNVITPHFIDKNGYVLGGDFVEFLRNIFDAFDMRKTTQKMHNYHLENGNLEKQKIYEKINEKIEDIFNVFEEETKNEKLAFSEFVVLLNNVFEGTKLSVVPLGVDQVFVGDVSKSFFESGKIFFLCGANQDKMPDFQKDVGLISDKDIARFSGKVKIDPTIRTINLRKRLKLCSVLSIPKQKLFVSWVALGDDGKKLTESTFVLGLVKMFAENVQKIGFAGEIQSEDFAKQISNSKRAKQQLVSYLQNPNIKDEIYFNSLFDILKKSNPTFDSLISQIGAQNNVPNLTKNELFFANQKFSVSALETYAKCPFMFFLRYGLGVEEKRPLDLDEATIGNIIHKCLEQYFSTRATDVDAFVDSFFKQISTNEKYSIFFAYKKYASILNSIKRECKQTIRDIICEQDNSNFKIGQVESYVGGKNVLFEFGGRKIAFGGIVDRIDRYNNKVIVVDYKTGKAEHEIEDIIFGNKIQIFVYLKTLEETRGVEAVGALYYPISAKRKKKNQKTFLGFLVEDELDAFDKTLRQEGCSKALGVKLKKDGTLSSNKTVISRQEFSNLMNIAKSVMEQNLKNISEGFISPSPLNTGKLPCEYCKFLGICKFDSDGGNKYRMLRKVEKQENE